MHRVSSLLAGPGGVVDCEREVLAMLISAFALASLLPTPLPEPAQVVHVVVATRDLYPGVTIRESDVYVVAIAPRYLPDGVLLNPELAVSRIPRERILANEYVRTERLAIPEAGVGMNAIIPRGMRAISVEIGPGPDDAVVAPGRYVDLLVKGPEPTRRTLLQAVFVLGTNLQGAGDLPRTAALLVTSDQAERVALEENSGTLQLVWRQDLLSTEDEPAVRRQNRRSCLGRVGVDRRPSRPAGCREMVLWEGGRKVIRSFDRDGVSCD